MIACMGTAILPPELPIVFPRKVFQPSSFIWGATMPMLRLLGAAYRTQVAALAAARRSCSAFACRARQTPPNLRSRRSSHPECRRQDGGGNEAVQGTHRAHGRDHRDGPDSRRRVCHGQSRFRRGSQGRRRTSAQGEDRTVLDGQVRDHLGRVRGLDVRPGYPAPRAGQDGRQRTGQGLRGIPDFAADRTLHAT